MLTILFFHPDPSKSHANRALGEAARSVSGVELVDMQALYPDGAIDVGREVRRLLETDALVLQFPIRWYSTPPLLQEWQDTVLTRMFYIHPETEGDRLKGLPFLVAATAGNRPSAYSAAGVNLFPLPELLRPLQSTAHRCGFAWNEPFTVFEANRLKGEAARVAGERYVAALNSLAAQTAVKRELAA